MKYVDFYFSNKAEGRVVLKGGKITYEGLPEALVDELGQGLYDMKESVKRKKPCHTLPTKEPEKFLKALHIHYRGSYVRASAVQNG